MPICLPGCRPRPTTAPLVRPRRRLRSDAHPRRQGLCLQSDGIRQANNGLTVFWLYTGQTLGGECLSNRSLCFRHRENPYFLATGEKSRPLPEATYIRSASTLSPRWCQGNWVLASHADTLDFDPVMSVRPTARLAKLKATNEVLRTVIPLGRAASRQTR